MSLSDMELARLLPWGKNDQLGMGLEFLKKLVKDAEPLIYNNSQPRNLLLVALCQLLSSICLGYKFCIHFLKLY